MGAAPSAPRRDRDRALGSPASPPAAKSRARPAGGPPDRPRGPASPPGISDRTYAPEVSLRNRAEDRRSGSPVLALRAGTRKRDGRAGPIRRAPAWEPQA